MNEPLDGEQRLDFTYVDIIDAATELLAREEFEGKLTRNLKEKNREFFTRAKKAFTVLLSIFLFFRTFLIKI